MKKQAGRKTSSRKGRGAPKRQSKTRADDVKSARQVHRLARDLVRVGRDSVAPIDHAECEAMLEWYVSDERSGRDVRLLYPAVWNHLQGCRQCAESYELIRAGLGSDVPQSLSIDRPLTLAFLSEGPFETWRLERSSALSGRNPRVGFRINPVYLQKLLYPAQSGPSALPTLRRGDLAPLPEAVLLSDAMQFGSQTFMVRAWLVRSPQATNRADIQFEVASPDALPGRLVAHLEWGEREYETRVQEGKGRFEQLALPDFAGLESTGASRRFRLSFESREDEAD